MATNVDEAQATTKDAAPKRSGSSAKTATAGSATVQELMKRTLEGMQPKQVFGDPIERDGVLYLPAAKVRGGGGGGNDTEGAGGGGFGLTAKPAGMYVIRDGDASWEPALDLNRVILGGQLVGIFALFVIWRIFRRR
jgi:hypothetical protein